jgi:hypothetical protein
VRRLRLSPLRLAIAVAAAGLAGVGVAHAATLGLSSAQLWAGSQTLAKGTCTPSESDAEIRAGQPTQNFGNQSSETILSKNNGVQYVLIGFDLAGSPCSLPTTGGADSAVLTIDVTSTFKGPDTVSAYPITSPWDASTVTWNTMPAYDPTADFSFSGVATYAFTVTARVDAAIKSGSFYGWMLIDTTGTNNAQTVIAGNGSGQAPSIALSYAK